MSSTQHIERGGGHPWHKRVLIPFWILQMFFMAIQIAAASLGIYRNTPSSTSSTTVYRSGSNQNTTVYTTGSVDGNNAVVLNDGSTVSVSFNSTMVIVYVCRCAAATTKSVSHSG